MFNFLKGRLLLVRLVMLLAAIALFTIGVLTIYAVSNPAQQTDNPASSTSHPPAENWKKQIQFAVIAVAAFLAVNLFNYRKLGPFSYWIYAAVLCLLALLILDTFVNIPFVPLRNNTRRWIQFTVAGRQLPAIQPSELCKLAYVLALAWYLRFKTNYKSVTALIGPFALTLLPMILILLEPDLGTVMLMMPVLFIMLFVAGAKIKHLLLIILFAVLLSPFLWHFVIRDYQRARIGSVALQSEWVRDMAAKHPKFARILIDKKFSERQWKREEGFHLIRSKYAVASGGLTGYGFRKGPFVKYNFLPYRHNDFIFAAFAHQTGFLGCLLILFLFALIIAAGLEIAVNNTDPFARLLAIGIVATFAVEVIVNVAMTLGLMPITGLTLPFVSYGGSSLLTSSIALGLLNNIGRRRFFTVAPKSFENTNHNTAPRTRLTIY